MISSFSQVQLPLTVPSILTASGALKSPSKTAPSPSMVPTFTLASMSEALLLFLPSIPVFLLLSFRFKYGKRIDRFFLEEDLIIQLRIICQYRQQDISCLYLCACLYLCLRLLTAHVTRLVAIVMFHLDDMRVSIIRFYRHHHAVTRGDHIAVQIRVQ